MIWDYDTRQLSGTLTFEQYGTAIYDLDTGELLAISDEFGRALNIDQVQFSVATSYNSDEPYPCVGWGPQGLDAIYDVNNQRVILQDSVSNEVIKVVESNITLNLFRAVSYSPSCQYMKASVILGNDTRETTIIWDLWRSVPTRVFTVGDAHERPHHIYWSPNSTYAVLKTRRDARLLNLQTSESFRLTADLDSDCFHHYKGCSGSARAFHNINWDFANNHLQLQLIFGNIVKYDLNTGNPIAILDKQGNSVSPDREHVVRQRLNSPFGCTHDLFYHATNNTLAIKDWLTGEEVFIVDDNLDIWSFEPLGYSPTCTYVIAKVGLEGQSSGSILIWSLTTGERLGSINIGNEQVEINWSQDGNNATVHTSNITYGWNLSSNQIVQDK